MLKYCLLLMAVAVPANAQTAQEWTHRVQVVKDQLAAAGVDFTHGPGECGRFEIVKHFAWTYRAEGVGLIAKFGGQNGCSATNTTSEPKYGVDVVQFPDGSAFDILIGPNNEPGWLPVSSAQSLYRAPFDPGPIGPTPPTPTPGVDLEQRVTVLEQRLGAFWEIYNAFAASISGRVDTLTSRMDYLEAKPLPIGCKASAKLGLGSVPLSCSLTYSGKGRK